jgi:hypothetical protein
MKTLLIASGIVLMASMASAQTPVPSPTPPTVKIAWDADGINTDGYKLFDDTVVILANIPPNLREIPFPALTPGAHNLFLKAFNTAGDSGPSNVLAVRVVVIPSAPTNMRIITAKLIDGVGWVPAFEII